MKHCRKDVLTLAVAQVDGMKSLPSKRMVTLPDSIVTMILVLPGKVIRTARYTDVHTADTLPI